MEAILDAQGLWEVVEAAEGVVVDEKKSKLARAFLFQAMPEDLLLQVAKKKTAREVWESLKVRFLGAERVQKARVHSLESEFEGLRMKDTETIDDYAGKLSGMVSKFSSLGATLEDSKLVRKLLNTVPERFIQLVASIEQYSDLDKMPFEEIIGRLKAYEDRLKTRQQMNASTESQLLLSKGDGKQDGRWNGRGTAYRGRGRASTNDRGGRSGSRGRGNGRGRGDRGHGNHYHSRDGGSSSGGGTKPKDKKNIKCFKCEQFGHYASECDQGKKEEPEANLVQGQEEEPSLFLSVHGEETSSMILLNEEKVFPGKYTADEVACRDTWYLDNGASNHMTGHIQMFAEIDKKVVGSVKFGDGSKVEIKGKGSIVFNCKNGDQFILSNVYYIPALCSNVVSLGQMTEEGYEIEMKQDYLRMHDDKGRLVMKVQRSTNRLYKIVLTIGKQVCLAMKLNEEAWVWHARLGHTNFKMMEEMNKKRLVEGLPYLTHPSQICEGCLVAKQPRKSFPSQSTWRATRPLALIHADICGHIDPATIGGKRYYLLFVDDYTRYMWIYLLKTKDEAFTMFKIFKAQVERQSGLKIQVLRTDRGGEFTSNQFNEFCQLKGIKRHLTAPYTPQQNGVVERRNRTIMEMTRSLTGSP
ncbi:putative RNA-directed DNA polymerase [Helianthus debilis subsp. tardiflorus]